MEFKSGYVRSVCIHSPIGHSSDALTIGYYLLPAGWL